MSSYEAVLDLVDRIYAAAEAPALWAEALDRIADATGSAASILYRNMDAREGGVDVAVRVSPDAARAYQQYFHKLDPWGNSPRAATLVKSGAVVDGDELIARSELYATEYYNDFARPNGLTRVLTGIISRDGPFASVISLIRDDGGGEHGVEDRRLLCAVMPHLTRAVQIHRRLLPVSVLDGAAVDALDCLASGVALLDGSGRTIFLNRAAERLLRQRDGLSIEHGCLVASVQQERDALRGLIAQAAQTTAGARLHAGGALAVSRPSMARPYAVLVTPLGRRHTSLHGLEAAVAVFMSDPDDRGVSEVNPLVRLFRLTPAEARLAAGIATGAPLMDVADALGIGRETARTQLRSVFAKTGTTRQAELVRIIARACPLIPS
ncbi:MAG TPA: helix-turn-helix transcriptional regulator [Vicinamibacterales bacterium]|nr:helix-turn-helix transcriptional regulator [Vicinamibacterales bacterium]